MAQGDIFVFDEAMAFIFDGGWEAADDIKCAILDDTLSPAVGITTPSLDDYNEVGASGTYVAGGTSLGSWGTLITETSGTAKCDSSTNPTWATDAGNDTDAYWALLYNDTQAGNPAFAYVDLGGPVSMVTDVLTVTWNASGIFTVTK